MSLDKSICLGIMTLSLILFSLLFVSCDEAELFIPKSLKERKIDRDKIPKKISMLFITQTHCLSCKELEQTMELEVPKKLINSYFTKKIIYLGEKIPDNLPLPNGTPTVYFVGYKNELLIQPMIGEKDEESLIIFLEDALREYKTLYDIDLTLTKEDNNEKNNTNRDDKNSSKV